MKIPIIELFYSFQGEPYSTGKSAVFVRFPNCNLNCKWCDSKYASRAKTWKEYELEEVEKKIKSFPANLIVFTGGEPLLHREEIEAIVDRLNLEYNKLEVEIETNGTLYPLENFNCRYNISPKLSSSGNDKEIAIQIPVLKKFNEINSIFKFVVKTKQDWEEMEEIIKQVKIEKNKVWVMPEGQTKARWIQNDYSLGK